MLPRLIGFHKAMELVLLGDRLTATQACTLGLVNRVVPHTELDERALELAHRLAEAPTAAVGVAKRMLNRSAGMDRLDVQLDAELTELTRIADGDNFAEGLAAFLERRAPEFGVE
jgi:2-(1,2-epoxy-1,2-dihydrophenyl)acetyl-CoA isomerase